MLTSHAAAALALVATASAYTLPTAPAPARALRRRALGSGAVASAVAAAAAAPAAAVLPDTYLNREVEKVGAATRYVVPPLPYAYDALEPVIDKATMEFHHDVHHKAYVDMLNKAEALKTEPARLDYLQYEVLVMPYRGDKLIRNGAGGHYNHCLFWKNLAPVKQAAATSPSPALLAKMEKKWGSFDGFKAEFAKAANGQFGAGWCWLVTEYDSTSGNVRLNIRAGANQQNPLQWGASSAYSRQFGIGGVPILGLDVWEHAYYLKYQNRRADYVDQFFSIINWDNVNENYEKFGKVGIAVEVGGTA